ncbi:C2 domain-containing protein At1g53590-like [Helianthus annuus]|nr:C2 domain-containing protein At1g53590-like [Helianthus annuus]
MKCSDMNGLADPYVKGHLGAYRFRTKTQRKRLSPKWQEEFKIPITTWESPNLLIIQVCNKDHFIDDTLGDCSIEINDLRDGQRHDMWLPFQNIKTGRLHIAIQVSEVDTKVTEQPCDANASTNELSDDSPVSDHPRKKSGPVQWRMTLNPLTLKANERLAYGFTIRAQEPHKFGSPGRGKPRYKKVVSQWVVAQNRDCFQMMSFSDDSLEGSNKISARNRVK